MRLFRRTAPGAEGVDSVMVQWPQVYRAEVGVHWSNGFCEF